jgi:transcriptional regulator GlxA family with amidase domain
MACSARLICIIERGLESRFDEYTGNTPVR